MSRTSLAPILPRRSVLVAALAVMAVFSLLLSPGSAFAGVSGQLEAWGPEVGAGTGQVFDARPMGVDSADGSVFVGSFNASITEMVFQKFSDTGEFEGSVALPGIAYVGIAVDSTHHRFYVMKDQGGAKEVTKILAFSTIPNGSKQLVPAADPELPVPSGAATLFHPQDLVIDPSTGDLIALAKNEEELTVLQRIDVDPLTGAGTVSESYVDEGEAILPMRGIAVDGHGVTFVVSYGGEELMADTLPAGFTQSSPLTPVPGFEAVSREGVALLKEAATFNFGPQIAVSTSASGDDTIFWKREATDTVFTIESYSVAGEARASVFGGGETEGECNIVTVGSSLAPGENGSLVVFDQGNTLNSPTQTPVHLPIVYTFGPGGSGCPAPAPTFGLEAEGKVLTGTPASVPTGTSVTFDDSGSELKGGTVEETIWKVEGPGGFTEKLEGDRPTFTHATALGSYTIRMTIKLEEEALSDGGEVGLGSVFTAQPQTLLVTPPRHTLTIGTTGTGTVECEDEGGTSFGPCGSYTEGHVVKLKETPGAHFSFAGWSGLSTTGVTTPCTGTVTECEVKIEADTTGSATFARITHTLTVAVTHTGSVAAEASPAPVSGGPISGCEEGGPTSKCSATYGAGETVKLIATPGPGKKAAWGAGDCTTEVGNTCEVTIPDGADPGVDVEFLAAAPRAVSVTVAGSGEVGAEAAPAPQSGAITGCQAASGQCAAVYNEGETITLHATPGAHQGLAWSVTGAQATTCAGTVTTCTVTLGASTASITAMFTPITHTLTIATTGTGTVGCKDEGASSFGSCTGPFDEGHIISLKATPGSHFALTGWSGLPTTGVTTPCTGTVTECEVKLEADTTGSATFAQITHTLTVVGAGTGSGSVSCDGSPCPASASHAEGSSVTLVATAASGSTFAGWSGGGCTGTGTCKVTLEADTTLTATFTADPPSGNPGGGPGGGNPGGGGGTVNPGGGPHGQTPAGKLAEKRKKAIARCKKLSGKAEAKCLKKARRIGKPEKTKKAARELAGALGRELW